MKLTIHKHRLEIVPEDSGYPNYDERDTAYIENILGLKKDGDSIRLVRMNAMGLSSLAYLKTELRTTPQNNKPVEQTGENPALDIYYETVPDEECQNIN